MRRMLSSSPLNATAIAGDASTKPTDGRAWRADLPGFCSLPDGRCDRGEKAHLDLTSLESHMFTSLLGHGSTLTWG